MSGDDSANAALELIEVGEIAKDLATISRDAPALNVYKETENLELLGEFTELRALHAREVPPAIFESALDRLAKLEQLSIFGTRMETLRPIVGLPLRFLRLVWAHKIEDLEPIGTLDQLEILAIGDMKRARDFSPLGRCKKLSALHIESGMWSGQAIDSLGFLRDLPQLEELTTHHLKIADDDLTPICALTNLKRLSLPTKYPVREYARMSVCLPETECDQFRPYTSFEVVSGFGLTDAKREEHVVLVGKPSSGFARSDPKCEPAINKREALIERWREHYRSVDNPARDTLEKLP